MPFIQALRCVGCGGGLLQHGALLDCARCGRAFPVLAGVPVMLADAVATRAPLMDPAAARDVLHRIGAPHHPISLLRLRAAAAARLQPPPLPAAPIWLGDTVPRAVRPAEAVAVTLRFRAGSQGLQATGERRCVIEAHWADPQDQPLAAATTPLADDLDPGEQASIRLPLQAPAIPGRYQLTLHLVRGRAAESLAQLGPLHIHVHEAAAVHLPASWNQDRTPTEQAPLALLSTWLARHAPANPAVLELGGGDHPLSATVFQADDTLLGLQLGHALAPDAAPHRVCAHPSNLPFAERAFDAIVCHDTLHRMDDPAQALRSARTHLRPGGFIALLAEPCDAEARGFTMHEYIGIFRAARLHAAHVATHAGTLHARLLPETSPETPNGG